MTLLPSLSFPLRLLLALVAPVWAQTMPADSEPLLARPLDLSSPPDAALPSPPALQGERGDAGQARNGGGVDRDAASMPYGVGYAARQRVLSSSGGSGRGGGGGGGMGRGR